ncbi:hypothetical protein [Flagellimonas pelagia]|uniref:Uncharacterized protein n=1 Tax=Flagellimonas pelagia TaxID=2306998 RepID=A0A3A1NLD5_9FLAO|nr:hypothetical protein [Allomuricauda maritima]RIV43584.1 hypothetical protein D2V05_12795 [Allomuricauda maritima]TXJ93201.1 hypothetical protein FQ017_12675 [Allomuricauda maritima]
MKKNPLFLSISLLFLFGCISCTSSKQTEFNTIEMPAYEHGTQNEVLRTIMNYPNPNELYELWVNEKEYPIAHLKKILDTLDPNYTIQIKMDSTLNKKLLFLKSP